LLIDGVCIELLTTASPRAFANIPSEELYIFKSDVPGPLAKDRVAGLGPVPITFTHRMSSLEPIRMKYGQVHILDSSNFPATTTSAALVEVEPGGMRELHWHPNADEWQYHLSGQSRMTVFASGGAAQTFDYQAGDAGYVPRAMPHYVENTENPGAQNACGGSLSQIVHNFQGRKVRIGSLVGGGYVSRRATARRH
jgi:oxalate decarboxylase family bicupin protein